MCFFIPKLKRCMCKKCHPQCHHHHQSQCHQPQCHQHRQSQCHQAQYYYQQYYDDLCLYEKENDNCCKDTKVPCRIPCQTGISKPNKLYNINFNNNKECDFNLNLEKHNLIKVKKSKHKISKHKKSKHKKSKHKKSKRKSKKSKCKRKKSKHKKSKCKRKKSKHKKKKKKSKKKKDCKNKKIIINIKNYNKH